MNPLENVAQSKPYPNLPKISCQKQGNKGEKSNLQRNFGGRANPDERDHVQNSKRYAFMPRTRDLNQQDEAKTTEITSSHKSPGTSASEGSYGG